MFFFFHTCCTLVLIFIRVITAVILSVALPAAYDTLSICTFEFFRATSYVSIYEKIQKISLKAPNQGVLNLYHGSSVKQTNYTFSCKELISLTMIKGAKSTKLIDIPMNPWKDQ